ncbi:MULTISPECIES: hypothetical protein [unclassified Mesorhizobium]|uniref:hypothetical protein n=1 Tax=unclassified Mesorhizobium TaxID=325217 RepID=UPI000BB07AF6|nr:MULTISPECIES: hypothetical protein [unclassified Mesorhizobium]TGT59918.1 hypothetical protein EN813_025370 [Mesorhizobium sp. M00.F.Ca.ET.170.01.1.1]AZO08075.1 hypothetical protein EJ074_02270 [Mesorhizobium sp. M3A.F.Ca.ET.080.04.2.1]PBB86978.1 hypothetical protein CK216_08350 [Mesorhizobium sp. WSM3876]RWB70352.1 MAG: hypothetical protein EOQ49_18620 [Mesorhizobium sp.]RWB91417.1 MAG: hypothetical protein EOQ52_08350 [Mesorhizobium sp.]
MVGYVLKRILMALAGYLVAVLAGLIAIVAIYAVLSALPNAPAYFDLMGVTPIMVLVVPPLGIFVYFLTIVVTGAQTLVFALIAEFFSLRNFWLHMLFGAAAAAAGFLMLWPGAPDEPERWADIGIIAAAGLVAGLVYWLIAGRDAGFRRPPV